MQRLEVSGAVRHIYMSLGVKGLTYKPTVRLFSQLSIFHYKAIPLHAWTGPEGSRRFRLPDFMTIST
jgi:hypothetical protein